MTECARCGDCCDPVILPVHPHTWARQQLDGDRELSQRARYQYEFWLEHWQPIGVLVSEDDDAVVVAHQVACDQFDHERRLCMAHDSQPDVCSGFPWYGRPEDDIEGRQPIADSLSPRCSFNADVPGRTFLPVVEVT